jgi:hypothetical protein
MHPDPFGLSLSKPCAGLRQAQPARLHGATALHPLESQAGHHVRAEFRRNARLVGAAA